MSIKRFCVVPGCFTLIDSGSRCAQHPKRKVPGTSAYQQLRRQIVQSATHCGICHQPFAAGDTVVVDHVIPRVHGGTDDPRNLQAAHRACNGAKSSHLPTT